MTFFVSQSTNIANGQEANYNINCGFMFPSLSQQRSKGCFKISFAFHGWASKKPLCSSPVSVCVCECVFVFLQPHREQTTAVFSAGSAGAPNSHFSFVNSKNTK